ncbi:hypothetical protein ISS04_02345 [Candidatus Woesearchaeota archaeon]|nr:hypothetical protein [Candidatus Woesearchaeota archaeon]
MAKEEKGADDLEDIKKLSPEERIDRLRKFEENKKKEIEEAHKLIEESVSQIKKEEELRDEIETPKPKQVDITKLFEGEEGNLESVVEREKKQLSEGELEKHRQYQHKLSKEAVGDLYNRVKDVYNQVKESGNITSEQQDQLNDINYAMQYKSNDIKSGTYKTASEEISDVMDASKGILNYIRGGR